MNASNSPNDGVNTLPIFANSGHHYVFVPVDRFTPASRKLNEGEKPNDLIQTLCREDRMPWAVSAERSWIRYRPGKDSKDIADETLGFWVCVESNVGTAERGLIYEFELPVAAREVSPDTAHPGTPYAYADVNQIDAAELNLSINVMHPLTKESLGTLKLPPIQWIKPDTKEPIDVDLVIDFGNTRTVAMLVECRDAEQRLSSICRPVRFVRRGTAYQPFDLASAVEDPCTIVDSWIVLQEPLFAEHEPPSPNFDPRVRPKIGDLPQGGVWPFRRTARVGVVAETKYMPQMFVELSPALLGGGNGIDGARQILRDSKLKHDKNFFLSSPKRYAWDDDPVGIGSRSFWNVELNRWNPAKDKEVPNELPQLKGPVLLFMDQDGRYWDLDAGEPPPNERPAVHQRPHAKDDATHPRRDSLTWAALTVIETAHRQLASAAYRSGHKPWCPRRLRQIVVTFPSGWTTQELENYRRQWQKAVNIFALGHLNDRRRIDAGGERPLLITDLDEAVASQLPVIFSEGQKLREPNAWFDLVGRRSAPDGRAGSTSTRPIFRIMNIDIGGGTTDVAIAEYSNTMPGRAVNLNATLLFKNSNTISGDSLVKRLIERVLLPQLATSIPDDKKANFTQFFRDPREEWVAKESTLRRKMARIVHLALVPIIHHWLKEFGEGRLTDEDNEPSSPDKMRDKAKERVVDQAMVQELNDLAKAFIGHEILNDTEPLQYDSEEIDRCIRELFTPLFRSYGRLVAAFDCDLVFVSGKPSELPQIQELLERYLPLPKGRIQLAKGYEVGSWYPISAPSGSITDAKTITVVGAALRQAMTNGLIRDWRLSYTAPSPILATDNYWGLMPSPDSPGQFEGDLILDPDQTENTCELMLGARIGRMLYRSPLLMPDQIYLLRWRRGRERRDKNLPLKVRFKRITDSDAGFSELLKLVGVWGTDSEGKSVTLEDIELQLRTLPDDAFWMDNPRFNIHEEG